MSTSGFFKPFQFKSLNLRNRFVMAPMTRTQSPGGIPTQAVVDYYSRRAQSEVGLILSEGTVINRPASSNHPNIPHFYGEEALGGWKKVIEAVHRENGQMGPQIWHVGKVPPQDPSTKLPAPQESPESMSVQDIEKTIQAFGDAAGEAKRLGFDCVELHGAHGYLIDQFFWDKTNQRSDAFGGKTIGERNRFAVEVVKAVRRAIGPDLALILRLSQWKQQDYKAKLAQTPKEMEQWLLPLSEAGVDIFHCSQRKFWDSEFDGSDLSFAGWAKKITGSPTITVGSVGLNGDLIAAFGGASSSPQELDELGRRFERGDFDLIAVGRAILQDPLWVLKIKDGRKTELETFTAASLAKYY
jgi:2,4-dienoyl-CoA reductase-like NADH-dependent reductase (Old Yellow Enzyme family)